jgi:murein L,D-transpeptidase YcbB/YkuD
MNVLRAFRLLLPLLLAAAFLARPVQVQAQAGAFAPIPPAEDAAPALAAPGAASEIRNLLAGAGDFTISGRRLDRVDLAAIYRKRDFRPLWSGPPRAELVASLAEAPSQGLDPGAFALPETDPAQGDILLTDAFLRYAQALARGRVSPGDFEKDYRMPQPAFDADAALAKALKIGPAAALAALAPSDPGYALLRQAYLRYQAYVSSQAWRPVELALPLQPGDSGDDVAKLRQRLAAENYLAPQNPAGNPAGSPDHAALYDGDLQAAVARFQETHGLPPDGIVNRATLTALNISPGERLREIRLNLERARALPRDIPPARVEINLPDASLVLYRGGQAALAMHAMVGSSAHPSPVLLTRMTAVTFNPQWIVPGSIIRAEIAPAAQKDPDYLARYGYAYVATKGGKQLVQKPGPGNALGRVKFEMPNALEIYLHDTPMQAYMDRSRRALSHGCIRVGDPRALARSVLAGLSGWTDEAIGAAIDSGKTQTVALKQAIPVYLFYRTVYADAGGAVEFRADLYGRDRLLNQALLKRDLAEQLAPEPRLAGLPGKT